MKTRKPRIMQTVCAIAADVWVPSGTAAVVTATGSGRFQIEPVCGRGRRYWCDADAIEVMP